MEAVTYLNTSIQIINENGDIKISITEENDEILQGFTLKARRKRLRRLKYHQKCLEASLNSLKNMYQKDCMTIIILQRALLSQALTDSIRTQHEEGQIVTDNGGCFTCKKLISCTFDVCLVIFLVLFIS